MAAAARAVNGRLARGPAARLAGPHPPQHTRLTGDGVDAVFDPIGGARQLWRSYRALRNGGRLVWFGVAATSKAGMRVIPLSLLTNVGLTLIPDGKRVSTTPNADNAWYRETLSRSSIGW